MKQWQAYGRMISQKDVKINYKYMRIYIYIVTQI